MLPSWRGLAGAARPPDTLNSTLGRSKLDMSASARTYRFTFGPWNISTGSDPFGPPVRKEVAFAAKLREYKKLGFDGVQFHDDDAVPPDQIDSDPATLVKTASKVKKV